MAKERDQKELFCLLTEFDESLALAIKLLLLRGRNTRRSCRLEAREQDEPEQLYKPSDYRRLATNHDSCPEAKNTWKQLNPLIRRSPNTPEWVEIGSPFRVVDYNDLTEIWRVVSQRTHFTMRIKITSCLIKLCSNQSPRYGIRETTLTYSLCQYMKAFLESPRPSG